MVLGEDINSNPLTVSEITRNIKMLIQSKFSDVYLLAEISNFKRHIPSGHCYFTLKDSNSSLSAVLWSTRYETLNFIPKDGMQVLVWGKITVFEPRGAYQIDVNRMSEFGKGELQLAFENLKKRLFEEGLFDEQNKKELPTFPERVGVITSETGAVIEDIKRVAGKRFPYTKILLFPATVQGSGSEESVLKALEFALKPEFNIDVIIIARGGGSLEDLWTFNSELIARRIFNSEIPIVSAIGHDVDYTICDFVADVRAATPSHAAEIVFPNMLDLLERLKQIDYYVKICINDKISFYYDNINRIEKSYVINKPLDLLEKFKQLIDDDYDKINKVMKDKIDTYRNNLKTFDKILVNISPNQTLKRGYSYVMEKNKIISRKKNLTKGAEVNIKFYDGDSEAKIIN